MEVIDFCFYLNGLLGITCVLLFSLITERWSGRIPVSWVKWIGFNSLYFLFLENPIKGFTASVIAKLFNITTFELSKMITPSMVVFVISTVLTAIAVRFVLFIRNALMRKNCTT